MVGKKKILWMVLSFVLVTVVLIGCTESSSKPNKIATNDVTADPMIKIGITQLIEHPALDASREGFIDGLIGAGFVEGESIEFDLQNAQGDIATAQIIGESFASQKKDLILAIATPSAQTALQATKEIPILITAITDPVAAGLAESWESSGNNITGTSNRAPGEKLFQLMKTLAPNAKSLGILYNPSEANSEVQVNDAKELAPQFNMELITASVTSINDVNQSLDYLLDRVDILYTINDNVVASSIPLIATKAIEKGIPTISSDPAHVQGGTLATEGINYYNLGMQTAAMAIEVLNGKKPTDIPIGRAENLELSINLDTAEKLNIAIPEELKQRAILIKDGVIQND